MDRLLRDVQVGLVPGREPAPPLTVPEPPPAVQDEPVRATVTTPPPTDAPQVQALTELSARLLASTRELLAGYERILVPSARPPRAPRRPARVPPDSPDV